jgi:RNA polymerase sigma factor (sigma-70 family)
VGSKRVSRNGKAPGGAFSTAGCKPAISLRTAPQGSPEGYDLDASPERIERMVSALFANEERLREERTLAELAGVFRGGPSRRRVRLPWEDKSRVVSIKSLEEHEHLLAEAREERDRNVAELRESIDYALTTAAFEDTPCPDCTLPRDVAEFVRSVETFEPPTTMCETCLDRKTVRTKKSDPESKSAFKRISYFERELEAAIACAEIRYGTGEVANAAFQRLESDEKNRKLIAKFGNESQTSLEGPDAEQGARQGLLDAALRFDPTKSSMASFNTYAYKWAFRNSRARHSGQKRAGVYARSIETLGKGSEEGGVTDLIASVDGALCSLSPNVDERGTLVLDMREKVSSLPEPQRLVIEAELAGMKTPEIADTLGMSRVRVRRLRDVAYGTLRERMTGYVEAIRD